MELDYQDNTSPANPKRRAIVTADGELTVTGGAAAGAALGAIDDVAVTNPASDASVIAALKGVNTLLASLISPGLSASVSVTRTADTNAYTANDVLGAATGGTAAMEFALAADSGANIMITSVAFERDAAAIISGETTYTLHLYNVTPPSALGDNAAFDLPSGDRASYLGNINLGTPIDIGSTLYVEQNGVNKQIKLAGTSVFAYLVTVGAYTPTSAAVHKVTLNAVQV